MADLKKYTAGATGRLLLHNNRSADDGVTHSNKEIDPTRTYLNYNIKKGSAEDIKKRLETVYHMNRKNAVVLAEAIVTLPKDVKPEDEQTFFKSVYDFYAQDFGEENIINAVVHKDERTPHIHLDFVPVLSLDEESNEKYLKRILKYEEKHGVKVDGTLNAYKLLNRAYFQKMHPRLSDFVKEDLGYRCEILNGATVNGNRSIDELKLQDLEERIRRKEQRLDVLNKNITILNSDINSLGIDEKYYDAFNLVHSLASMQQEIEVLQHIIHENGLEIPKKEIEEIIKDRIETEEHKSKFSLFSGFYDQIYVDGVRVIECFSQKERILPARRFIENNPEIELLIKNGIPKPTIIEHNNKEILLFPTDDEEETFRNFLYVKKKKEFEDKKIVFPKITNDSFNIGEIILRQCNFETEYIIEQNKDRRELVQRIMNAERTRNLE